MNTNNHIEVELRALVKDLKTVRDNIEKAGFQVRNKNLKLKLLSYGATSFQTIQISN